MHSPIKISIWRSYASLCLLWILSTALPVQAALSEYGEVEQLAYETVAEELTRVNSVPHQALDIEPETYWVDSINGIDDYNQPGSITQPWKSIVFATFAVPYEKNQANIVVRGGTYTPQKIYFGENRGGSTSSTLPFNVLAFPEEKVIIDGV